MARMRRVSVVGNSGSGKSTVAAALAARLGVPHVELDAIMHYRPGWEDRPVEEFRALATDATAGEAWVIDGNYQVVGETIWAVADTVVWIDLPRRTVMRQVIGRTVRRIWRQTELWGGNRENWREALSWDPDHSIIRWSWTQHSVYRERYQAAMTDPRFDHITFVRLQTRSAVEGWLAGVQPAAAGPADGPASPPTS